MTLCYHRATSEGEMVDQHQVITEEGVGPDDHGKLRYDPYLHKRNHYISTCTKVAKITLRTIKTVFHCSRFARAGGVNMFQLLL